MDAMNKRSAVLIASGLVLTLAIGGLAVSLGLTGPAPVNAAGSVRPERAVRVERKTVTIRRQAGSASAEPVMLSARTSGASTGEDSDDRYESEDESDSYEDFEEVESEDEG
jgi:hypothetical protein